MVSPETNLLRFFADASHQFQLFAKIFSPVLHINFNRLVENIWRHILLY